VLLSEDTTVDPLNSKMRSPLGYSELLMSLKQLGEISVTLLTEVIDRILQEEIAHPMGAK
jgi:hypothetical protein